ncbi:hypothetical protein [Kitasatospora sp. A2-31]|uniref:hypothetical protein n=1 Tax=Kitasatospora sp. A2-31 TaxID=2916414 RepID=UPI001EEDAEB3|nr:hypothetical protein [Kitasatospora sp. A2-31]MCG6499637.1 hypothetical protein [Kitasatospora sp. A2-31]
MARLMRLIYCHTSELDVAHRTLDAAGLEPASDTGEPWTVGGGSSLERDEDKPGIVKVVLGSIDSIEGEPGDMDFTVVDERGGHREEFYSQVPSSLFLEGQFALVKHVDAPYDPRGPMAGRAHRSVVAIYLEA